jgi:uncharacterized protein (DUF2384 family)
MSQTKPAPTVQDQARKEVEELFEDPVVSDTWLNTENPRLGGEKPGELIASGKAQLVRDLIQSIKYGAVT